MTDRDTPFVEAPRFVEHQLAEMKGWRARMLRSCGRERRANLARWYSRFRRHGGTHEGAIEYAETRAKETYGAWWLLLLQIAIPIIWDLLREWWRRRERIIRTTATEPPTE